MDIADQLAAAFRLLRTSRGLTQQEWGAMTGLPQSTISDVERGRHGFEAVRKLCDGLARAGVDPYDLLRLTIAQGSSAGPDDLDLLTLILAAPRDERAAVLTLLRRAARDAAVGR